ncbi:hypothetical protein BJ508DRAFT_332866 [Ascobolus immersus RN42]|uniref:Uncharacterized protein n=1 Tax=Ascobolus immersus RN42 TaxID=1160509 RepID=A0A3N4HY86_ASCIM|nr:hypothetical protein BJ508DRAFT_332866 [Ascobolus immersus RN42]
MHTKRTSSKTFPLSKARIEPFRNNQTTPQSRKTSTKKGSLKHRILSSLSRSTHPTPQREFTPSPYERSCEAVKDELYQIRFSGQASSGNPSNASFPTICLLSLHHQETSRTKNNTSESEASSRLPASPPPLSSIARIIPPCFHARPTHRALRESEPSTTFRNHSCGYKRTHTQERPASHLLRDHRSDARSLHHRRTATPHRDERRREGLERRGLRRWRRDGERE